MLVKDALSGNETALIELTWLLEHNQISHEDVSTILKNGASKKANQEARYLLACLYFFGAPGFEKNYEKCSQTLVDLAKDDFSYAKNLILLLSRAIEEQAAPKLDEYIATVLAASFALMSGKSDNEKYIEYLTNKVDEVSQEDTKLRESLKEIKLRSANMLFEAARDLNPLAIFSAISILASTYDINPIKPGMFVSNSALRNTIDKIADFFLTDFKYLAVAYKQLFYTHYRDGVDRFVSARTNDLLKLQEYLKTEVSKPYNPSLFEEVAAHKKELRSLSKLWLVLADYHKNVNQRSLMCNALQKAADLNPKHTTKLLQELGRDNLLFKEIMSYLQSFIEVAQVTEKKLSTLAFSSEQLTTVKFNLTVEYQNCHILSNHYYPKISTKDAKTLLQTMKECKKHYDKIFKDIENKVDEMFQQTETVTKENILQPRK